jgi:phage terminase small subunit
LRYPLLTFGGAMDDNKKITNKQRAFIAAYIANDFNATQAAIAAGYSEATAYSQGSRLLKNVEIRAAIDAFLEENTMSAKEVLFRLTQHARGDIGDIWDESTGQVDWEKARNTGKTGLIKTIYHKTTRISRGADDDMEIMEDQITLHDPQKALTLIGKQRGLFTDKQELEGEIRVILRREPSFNVRPHPDEADDDSA